MTRAVWGASLLAILVAGCREELTAPGTCPEFCPAKRIEVFDTLFVESISRDSAWGGYVAPHRAGGAQVVTDGTAAESRAVIRFAPFTADLDLQPIVSLDSFLLEVLVASRAALSGLELVIHRLPADLDSTATHASLEPFFHDSTQIGVIALPDTLDRGAVSVALPPDAFPTFEQDSFVTAVGLRIAAAVDGYVDLRTLEGLGEAALVRYATIELANATTVQATDFREAEFDSYVFVDQPAGDPSVLLVGGAPSWRSILRVDVPSFVVDSADVSRATLILVPSEPIRGASGDALRLRADALREDVGAKSPIIAPAPQIRDTISIGGLDLATGTSDTVRIDVTHVVKPWRGDTTRPRSIVLWIVPEASSIGQALFWSSRDADHAPALAVTYIPLFPRNEP